MSLTESIEYVEGILARERAAAAALSLAGWPGDANHHRRQALWCLRRLRAWRAML